MENPVNIFAFKGLRKREVVSSNVGRSGRLSPMDEVRAGPSPTYARGIPMPAPGSPHPIRVLVHSSGRGYPHAAGMRVGRIPGEPLAVYVVGTRLGRLAGRQGGVATYTCRGRPGIILARAGWPAPATQAQQAKARTGKWRTRQSARQRARAARKRRATGSRCASQACTARASMPSPRLPRASG
ncbi:hypothetical protein CBM2623_A10022 [Cupriavidus taiwanensis]|nr:hypothetical protein CBM2623_A10022 [Cupriavidus taiwanensis]